MWVLGAMSITPAAAREFVQFDSAAFKLGPLTERRLAESGVARPLPQTVNSYLYQPEAKGRRPAVIVLHGFAGLAESMP